MNPWARIEFVCRVAFVAVFAAIGWLAMQPDAPRNQMHQVGRIVTP